jgi:hypothetical protein
MIYFYSTAHSQCIHDVLECSSRLKNFLTNSKASTRIRWKCSGEVLTESLTQEAAPQHGSYRNEKKMMTRIQNGSRKVDQVGEEGPRVGGSSDFFFNY